MENKMQTIIAMTNQWSSLFGKHDFTYKGEYNCKIWSFKDSDGNYFFVISAPGRGTSIESNIDMTEYFNTGKKSKELKASVIKFTDFLYENLITLDDVNVNFWKNYTKKRWFNLKRGI
jgi:hypothetical protein